MYPTVRNRRGGRAIVPLACLVFILAFVSSAVAAEGPGSASDSDLTIRRLQKQVEQLQHEVAELRQAQSQEAQSQEAQSQETQSQEAHSQEGQSQDPKQLAELERRIDLLADELEKLQLSTAEGTAANRSEHGLGPAASKVYHSGGGASIGGYGELLYQNFQQRDDGAPAPRDTIDLLRAVVYVGYKFNDRYLFNSEIEFEHAGASDEHDGEAAVEFAYLDMLRHPELNVRAGLVLIPMGFLNELHEPTVYLSAQRPAVETDLLPTTWREFGAGIFGDVGPVSYRTYVVNGIDASRFEGEGIHEASHEGSEAAAEDFAWVGRADWTIRPGLVLGASAWLGNSGQGLRAASGRSLRVGTRIFEAHAEWRWQGLQVRGLFARASLSDTAALNRTLGLEGDDAVASRLDGGYVELGYDLFALHPHGGRSLTPFVRYETLDTQASMAGGLKADPANDRDLVTLGLAWKPMERIVVKTDYRNVSNQAGTGQDQFNIALGYVF